MVKMNLLIYRRWSGKASAKRVFSGILRGREGVRPTLQVLLVKVLLGLTPSLPGSQQRCDSGSTGRLVCCVLCSSNYPKE